jgi:glycosyltransferase involved in cell wall biosynthesis
MKSELLEQFGVRQSAVTVIPYGINNAVPSTGLSPEEAKQRLGIRNDEKTILFFGNIAPYKGLEYLLAAFEQIVSTGENYRLIVAGRSKQGCEKYVNEIQQALNSTVIRERTLLRIEFIPDEDMELYFMAADVSVLPYTHIFQSGVLFLAYAFGLPVIAADVGSLREDIVEGRTGFLFRPQDATDLARIIKLYFASALYKSLGSRRQDIRNYATDRHSWDSVSTITRNVYAQLLNR